MSVRVLRCPALWVVSVVSVVSVVWLCCVSSTVGSEAVVVVAAGGPEPPDYADYYYGNNEIIQDHREEEEEEAEEAEEEGASPATPGCQEAGLARWDKLFVALEDSHMRQNMLLDAVERGGEMAGEGAGGRRCRCPRRPERWSPELLRRLLAEMREEGAARERRTDATLQRLLQACRELSARLRRLEEEEEEEGGSGWSP